MRVLFQKLIKHGMQLIVGFNSQLSAFNFYTEAVKMDLQLKHFIRSVMIQYRLLQFFLQRVTKTKFLEDLHRCNGRRMDIVITLIKQPSYFQ